MTENVPAQLDRGAIVLQKGDTYWIVDIKDDKTLLALGGNTGKDALVVSVPSSVVTVKKYFDGVNFGLDGHHVFTEEVPVKPTSDVESASLHPDHPVEPAVNPLPATRSAQDGRATGAAQRGTLPVASAGPRTAQTGNVVESSGGSSIYYGISLVVAAIGLVLDIKRSRSRGGSQSLGPSSNS